MPNNNKNSSETAIAIQGVWKIFGGRGSEVMAAVEQQNMSKQKVLETPLLMYIH